MPPHYCRLPQFQGLGLQLRLQHEDLLSQHRHISALNTHPGPRQTALGEKHTHIQDSILGWLVTRIENRCSQESFKLHLENAVCYFSQKENLEKKLISNWCLCKLTFKSRSNNYFTHWKSTHWWPTMAPHQYNPQTEPDQARFKCCFTLDLEEASSYWADSRSAITWSCMVTRAFSCRSTQPSFLRTGAASISSVALAGADCWWGGGQ